MKKFFLGCLVSASAFAAAAQKTIHDPNVEVRSVEGFRAIKVSGGIDLYLSQGDEVVAVSAKDAEIRDHIKTEVVDGVLKIWFDWKAGKNILLTNHKQLKAYVSYKTLKALSGSGGSDIIVDGTIQVKNLDMNISGGSDFKGKVDVQELTVTASDGSNVVIEGKAVEVSVETSGGSDFNGFGLVTETAKVRASGGCDIEITVNKGISASASGGSDVRYKGGASVTETKSSGSSSVKKVS